jgi:hypothetical protein
MCDHPGPGGSTCVKPYGHTDPEGHQYALTMEVPPDVGRMLGAMLEDMERVKSQMEREKRYYKWSKYAFWGGFALYMVIIFARSFVS